MESSAEIPDDQADVLAQERAALELLMTHLGDIVLGEKDTFQIRNVGVRFVALLRYLEHPRLRGVSMRGIAERAGVSPAAINLAVRALEPILGPRSWMRSKQVRAALSVAMKARHARGQGPHSGWKPPRIRRKKRKSWEALAKCVGVHPDNIKRWRHNYADAPGDKNLRSWRAFVARHPELIAGRRTET